MNALQKYRFCFLAGLCAAGGSFFGKLPSFLKDSKLYVEDIALLPASVQTYGAFVLYQGLPIVLMILSNLLNWRYFLKALQLSEQTLTATVLTAASNYVVSFVLGSLVFKEPFTLLSILGSTLIVLGLWFLCADTQGLTGKEKKQ
ncbi:uncharacterized protein LOC135954887 [Calliphora vicina]|uniref:uncharacterized protein LOC135954887 n=1 Tax=Calliphora vicina TaxID=7373 RepID=UPI00325B7B2D